MKVGNFQTITYKPNFQRKLREDEKPEFSKTMNEAFDYLGVKNRALIIHGSSFPAEKTSLSKKNLGNDYYLDIVKNKNPYIGTPFFNKEFLEFAKMNGFNAIQLGPNGKLNNTDNSPYKSSIFAQNELFIDYERLKSDDYANILSDKDTTDVSYIVKNYDDNYDMTDFDGAKEVASQILSKAYTNFKTKLENKDEKAIKLNNEFVNFKKQNKNWLERDSVFLILSKLHGTDNFSKWDNELDKNLIARKEAGDAPSKARYYQILTTPKYKEKIEEYQFIQFLAEKQEKDDKVIREKQGIKYVGDLLVGYSNSDEWSNPDAFMKDWRVGAQGGGKNGGPQLWDIPVLNPEKLFNKDGSLGPAGQLMKQKIDKVLEGVENIRIDNVMGLVDPFIYKSSAVNPDGTINNSARGYMSHIREVDKNGNYPKILHNILFPSLKEHNIDPKDVVWEDLGHQSQTFRDVFYDGKVDGKIYPEEKMKGIMYSKGIRMEVNKDNYSYSFMATHDNEPSARLLNEDWIYSNEGWNPMYLAGYLIPPVDEKQAKISSDFCQKIEQDQSTRLKAKYAELFRGTPNIQVSFVDFFGMDKVYNQSGRNDVKDNWKLRLNADYQDTYHKSIETEQEPVMNMPELLGLAVNSKSSISKIKKELSKTEEAKINDLQARLAHWNNVLKEPC